MSASCIHGTPLGRRCLTCVHVTRLLRLDAQSTRLLQDLRQELFLRRAVSDAMIARLRRLQTALVRRRAALRGLSVTA